MKETIGDAHPDGLICKSNLGTLYKDKGDLAGAEELLGAFPRFEQGARDSHCAVAYGQFAPVPGAAAEPEGAAAVNQPARAGGTSLSEMQPGVSPAEAGTGDGSAGKR